MATSAYIVSGVSAGFAAQARVRVGIMNLGLPLTSNPSPLPIVVSLATVFGFVEHHPAPAPIVVSLVTIAASPEQGIPVQPIVVSIALPGLQLGQALHPSAATATWIIGDVSVVPGALTRVFSALPASWVVVTPAREGQISVVPLVVSWITKPAFIDHSFTTSGLQLLLSAQIVTHVVGQILFTYSALWLGVCGAGPYTYLWRLNPGISTTAETFTLAVSSKQGDDIYGRRPALVLISDAGDLRVLAEYTLYSKAQQVPTPYDGTVVTESQSKRRTFP